MTNKLEPGTAGLLVAANAEPKRTPRLAVAASGTPKNVVPMRRTAERRLVAVSDVLFAEMKDPALAGAFAATEIDWLAEIFGLSPDEVAELYRPASLKPAGAASPLRRRGRSIQAG